MSHIFTKRNHYNPCFWAALWNEGYYRRYCAGTLDGESAREQRVYALNLRANKILPTKVEQVHFHKNLGIAEITPESAKRFCARHYPAEYDQFCRDIKVHPEMLWIDFEEVLSGIEASTAKYLMQAAKLGDFESAEHKGFLICEIMIHAMRSFEFMSTAVKRADVMGVDKWEYFWCLKQALSNPTFLQRAATVAALSEWTLWRTSHHAFPLCDSPVMINSESLMVVLSPRLLLDINLNIRSEEQYWRICDGVPQHKYEEFQRRSIENTFKEIIFHDASVLKQWQSSSCVVCRVAMLRDPLKTGECIEHAAGRIGFGLNGFGRVLP